MKLHYLFFLVLTSSAAFSLYLYTLGMIVNPLVYVLIGWAPPVLAYYATHVWELTRLFVMNRTFESFICDENGWIWNGTTFIQEGEPLIFFNSIQVDHEIKKIIHATGNCDVFIKVMPTPDPDEIDVDLDLDE